MAASQPPEVRHRGAGHLHGPGLAYEAAGVDADKHHRPCFGSVDGHGRNSTLLTAAIIIADVVGAGILSMAVAVAKFGWLLGAVAVVGLLAMNVHISILLWRVRVRCPGAFTYVELAAAAFSGAPAGQRQTAVFVTAASQYTFLFTILGLYSLTLGKGLGMMLNDWRACLPVLTVCAMMALLPFQLTARHMGKWKSLIWLNVLTILGSVVVPLIHMAGEGTDVTRMPDSKFLAVAELSWQGVLQGLNVMTFAFTSQFMLVEIISEMEDPADMPKAYLMSAPFQGAAFLICGLGGYYFIGHKVEGMIGDNIPFGPTFRLAAACLFVHMAVTFLIKSTVFCRALHSYIDPSGMNGTDVRSWSTWTALVTLVFLTSWLLSQAVPFFTVFVELLGATLTPISCYLVPVALYLRWLHDRGTQDDALGPVEKCVIALEVSIAVVVMVAGTYFAVQGIVEQWHAFGRPFECHCEHIWHTCECSRSHAGMEFCDVAELSVATGVHQLF